MKNKKGITFGRVLLYILLCFLFLSIIWVLVLTYREIAKNPSSTTKIECDSTLRMQNDNDNIVRNLFNQFDYSFIAVDDSGSSSTNRCSTGAFTFLAIGTYTISFDSSFYNSYNYVAVLISQPTYNYVPNKIFDSGWMSSNLTFTVSTPSFFGLLGRRTNNSSIDLTDINSFNIMLNTGSTALSYIPYNPYFQNASSYISSAYFQGLTKIDDSSYPGGAAFPYCYLPISNVYVSNASIPSPYGTKTDYNISVVDSSVLNIGSNISNLYSSINNSTYNISSYFGFHFNNVSYNSTLVNASVYYVCSTPIPVYLFNFDMFGSDVLGSSNCVISLSCNDDINVNIVFSNLTTFNYESILAANPNIRSIYKFGFNFYYNSSIYDTGYSYSIPIQNKSWTDYSNSCLFYLHFVNFYGDEQWNLGFQEGYRSGQSAANEALQIAYDNAMIQVNDLTSQVNDLTSRVNSQSSIIDNLQNQINNANLGFKNFFFTMADVPFKTVSNVLGFEVFGLNLFQFFTGILTALGCIWLIKKFLQAVILCFLRELLLLYLVSLLL